MAEKKKTTATEKQGAATPQIREDAAVSEDQKEELGSRLDQVGSILSKGLDLVEAGITLGINLANRLSSALRIQTADIVDRVARPYPEPGMGPYEGPGMAPPPYAPYEGQRAGPAEAPQQINYVANRMPLFPGSPVQVSFTISNDSVSSPKELQLRVEGFAGEMRGASLDGQGFVVVPATRTIAPMDFDKFTLTGTIPPDAVIDTYRGWIVVSADEELRIPVRLVVTAAS